MYTTYGKKIGSRLNSSVIQKTKLCQQKDPKLEKNNEETVIRLILMNNFRTFQLKLSDSKCLERKNILSFKAKKICFGLSKTPVTLRRSLNHLDFVRSPCRLVFFSVLCFASSWFGGRLALVRGKYSLVMSIVIFADGSYGNDIVLICQDLIPSPFLLDKMYV